MLNTIETLVTLGDPELNAENQNEWMSLISKCLPCKTLPKHLDCTRDAECLQYVAGCFEKFTLHSTLFQVSGAAKTKRKHLLSYRTEDHRCIYSATMTVRWWTTTAEGDTIPSEEGDKKTCAFYPKSTVYNRLLSIPTIGPQDSISGTPTQLSVLETQTGDDPSTCCSTGESATNPTRSEPASPQATYQAMHLAHSTDTSQSMIVESSSESGDIIVGGVGDATGCMSHGDQHPNQSQIPLDIPAAEASDKPETLPCFGIGMDLPETTIVEIARPEGSDENIMQPDPPKVLSISESPRIARRSPFLSRRVPSRDAEFFGREELLIALESILIPGLLLPGTLPATPDSSTVIFLHGAPGVGKSAIALELIYRTQAAFDHVFWLHASSYLHLAQSSHEAAVSLGLVQDRRDHNHENSRQKLEAWLSTTCLRWLLVLDDADELQTLSRFLSRFVPYRHRGSIIVTSRQPLRGGLITEEDKFLHTFQISPFDVEEATQFLLSLLQEASEPVCAANSTTDLPILRTIAEHCRCLPLTLRRVGAILNRRRSSKNRRIMDVLEQHAASVLTSQPSSPLVYASLSSGSYALACVIPFLDPSCIDDAILLGAQRYKDFPLSAFPKNDRDYFDAKKELIAQALLTAGADASACNLHRVTAGSLRAKLDPHNFRQGFHCASRLLEARWPSRRKMRNILLGNWPEFDTLHSHVHELSSIFVDHDQKRKSGNPDEELFNNSYINMLLHSTW